MGRVHIIITELNRSEIVMVLTQTTGLLNHLKPLLCYVMLNVWRASVGLGGCQRKLFACC